jgi:hypothetical protein
MGLVAKATSRSLCPCEKPVTILPEAVWVPGCGKSCPYRDSIPDCPTRSESLHLLRHLGPYKTVKYIKYDLIIIDCDKLPVSQLVKKINVLSKLRHIGGVAA